MNIINGCLKKSYTLTPHGPYSFLFARTRYVIPAWYDDGKKLIRVLRDLDSVIGVTLYAEDEVNTEKIFLNVYSEENYEPNYPQIEDLLVRSLHLKDPISEDIYTLAESDDVIKAALKYNGQNRGKAYPSLFEAICGVICAQRTNFARIPQMMGKMAYKLAPKIEIDEKIYAAFPTPQEIYDSGELTLRECGLGFRAKRIYLMAEAWWREKIDDKNLTDLSTIYEELLKLPSIGVYTANLAINLTAHTKIAQSKMAIKEPHIDSYVCALISSFYFKGTPLSLSKAKQFIMANWGEHAETIVGLLTTDTNEWATPLGYKFAVKSGAQAQFHSEKK